MSAEEANSEHAGPAPISGRVVVPTSGLSLAFETFGERLDGGDGGQQEQQQVVVLLHGLGADMTIWPIAELIAPLVQRGCFVIRMDHRDSGCSAYVGTQP